LVNCDSIAARKTAEIGVRVSRASKPNDAANYTKVFAIYTPHSHRGSRCTYLSPVPIFDSREAPALRSRCNPSIWFPLVIEQHYRLCLCLPNSRQRTSRCSDYADRGMGRRVFGIVSSRAFDESHVPNVVGRWKTKRFRGTAVGARTSPWDLFDCTHGAQSALVVANRRASLQKGIASCGSRPMGADGEPESWESIWRKSPLSGQPAYLGMCLWRRWWSLAVGIRRKSSFIVMGDRIGLVYQ